MQNLVIKYEDKVAFAGSVDCDGRTLEFGEAFTKLSNDVDSEKFDLMLANIIGKFVLYTSCYRAPADDKPKQKSIGHVVDTFVQHFVLPGLMSMATSAASKYGTDTAESGIMQGLNQIIGSFQAAQAAAPQDLDRTASIVKTAVQIFADKNGITFSAAMDKIAQAGTPAPEAAEQ